ncbi:MAG: hypothetical protein QOF89_209 [Acidobacteriota bacterium]|jgi:hypothetical protein|nr:hypothetical protein [Acidobacteriota bacterium]
MATFTAQIVFTGICGIVPKKNYPAPPEAFCVVLPNAWKPEPDLSGMKTSKVDQVSRLRRHSPFVYFATQPRDILVNNRQDLEGLWFLQGHRLLINPRFEGDPILPIWDGIGGLASFDDIATPGFQPQLSVKNAVNTPNISTVAAQVVLHHGKLSSLPLNPVWVFESFLRRSVDPPVTKRLNFQVTVTLENLTSLEIVQTDFTGTPTGKSFTFSKGPAFVTVANLCDENPLQWGKKPAPESMPDDDDFRWHYEIVDSPPDLAAALDVFRCPIPRLTRSLTGGNGLNCLPLRFSEVNFSF